MMVRSIDEWYNRNGGVLTHPRSFFVSEYQYFEFRALDRPLTAEHQTAIRRISHEVELTPAGAVFTYTAGSFRADPKAVLAQYFDAMIHLTGWGDKRLMFRFPVSLVDLEQVKAYGDPLGQRVTWSVSDDYAILDIHFLRDSGAGWIEAERWLPSLAPLRTDILRGDTRLLYLAWLKSLAPEDAEDATEEPPVPPGMRDLSPQLEAFLELFEVDPYLLEVASQGSAEISGFSQADGTVPPFGMAEADARRAVEALPRDESDAYLLRIAWGEPLADVAMLRRLRGLAAVSGAGVSPRRTTAQLLAAAREARVRSDGQRAQAAEAQHIVELEDLAAREEQAWAVVERLVTRRGARAQDEAVDLLLKLRETAAYKGHLPAFEERMAGLCARVRGRRGLAGKLRAAKLCH
jgi:hypothetical protein